jgi:hypothetical protein
MLFGLIGPIYNSQRSVHSQTSEPFITDGDRLQGEQVLLCKFVQYPGLIRELLETDDAEIINVCLSLTAVEGLADHGSHVGLNTQILGVGGGRQGPE